MASTELAGALSALNDTLTSQIGALTVGKLPGAADINAGWTLQSGYLVFFMQAGFAMLCAGSVRAKNAKNIILLNLLDACLGVIIWWAVGELRHRRSCSSSTRRRSSSARLPPLPPAAAPHAPPCAPQAGPSPSATPSPWWEPTAPPPIPGRRPSSASPTFLRRRRSLRVRSAARSTARNLSPLGLPPCWSSLLPAGHHYFFQNSLPRTAYFSWCGPAELGVTQRCMAGRSRPGRAASLDTLPHSAPSVLCLPPAGSSNSPSPPRGRPS